MLQTALLPHFDGIGGGHGISRSAILKVAYNGNVLQSLVNEVVVSIDSEEDPEEVLKSCDRLQPLVMENLFPEGVNVSLGDSCKSRHGELGLGMVLEKVAVERGGDAWKTVP